MFHSCKISHSFHIFKLEYSKNFCIWTCLFNAIISIFIKRYELIEDFRAFFHIQTINFNTNSQVFKMIKIYCCKYNIEVRLAILIEITFTDFIDIITKRYNWSHSILLTYLYSCMDLFWNSILIWKTIPGNIIAENFPKFRNF